MRILDSIIIGIGVAVCILAILIFILFIGSKYSGTFMWYSYILMMTSRDWLPIFTTVVVGTTMIVRRKCN